MLKLMAGPLCFTRRSRIAKKTSDEQKEYMRKLNSGIQYCGYQYLNVWRND